MTEEERIEAIEFHQRHSMIFEGDKSADRGRDTRVLRAYGELRIPDTVETKTETISAVYAMQMKMGTLFRQMIGGEFAGYRVEMDRETFPATFTITTWGNDGSSS